MLFRVELNITRSGSKGRKRQQERLKPILKAEKNAEILKILNRIVRTFEFGRCAEVSISAVC